SLIRILTKSLIGSFARPLQNQTTQLIQLVLHISLQPLDRHTPPHATQNQLPKAQAPRPHLLNPIYHGRPHLLSTSVPVHCHDGEVFFRFLPLPTLSYSNVALSSRRGPALSRWLPEMATALVLFRFPGRSRVIQWELVLRH